MTDLEILEILNNASSKIEAITNLFNTTSRSLSNYKKLEILANNLNFDLDLINNKRNKVVCYCKHCQKEIKSYGKVFCSSACSATFNNLKKVKKEKPIKIKLEKIDTNLNITKEDLFNKTKNWQSARSYIQKRARKVLEDLCTLKICKHCEYSKHVEVAHIKAVSEFDNYSLLSEINDISNLMYLCPNCHWEFDNLK